MSKYQPRSNSVNDYRVLRQPSVLLQGFFNLFLRGHIDLPGDDVLLKQLGPGAIEVNLFAGAFVHDLKAVARQHGHALRVLGSFDVTQGGIALTQESGTAFALRLRVGQHVGHGKAVRVVKRVHTVGTIAGKT